MAATTLASVLIAPREFELRELDVPDIGPDAGLLKVEACGNLVLKWAHGHSYAAVAGEGAPGAIHVSVLP